MPAVAVLVNDAHRFARMNYFVEVLAEAWREMGIASTVFEVPGPVVSADVAFLHVNATKVPQACLDRAAGYPAVVNRRATDISKRHVSRRLVERGDGYEGPVIIKTDRNCGGLPERFGTYATPLVGVARRAWDRLAPWQLSHTFRYGRYPVLKSPEDVPRLVWSDTALVVEQFTPERHGHEYATRSWTFLGACEVNRLTLGPSPVVKSGNGTRTTDAGEVPAEVRAERDRLGLEYGKIDYVIVGDVPIVLDANLTPTYGVSSGTTIRGLADRLAPGIDPWLP